MSKSLLVLLLGYTTATVFHFFHNAIFLSDYPNMPSAISEIEVFGALALVLAIGAVGILIYSRKSRPIGLIVIAVYAAFGFDGLAHYALAPLSAHSFGMNLTILTEVATAALLLVLSVVQVLPFLKSEKTIGR